VIILLYFSPSVLDKRWIRFRLIHPYTLQTFVNTHQDENAIVTIYLNQIHAGKAVSLFYCVYNNLVNLLTVIMDVSIIELMVHNLAEVGNPLSLKYFINDTHGIGARHNNLADTAFA